MAHNPLGILLLYMGGASTTRDIKPFLYHLFSDREILSLPGPIRIPLAWVISQTRYHLVKGAYQRIGGSPLLEITAKQARALEAALNKEGFHAHVEVGMRYCSPFIREAVERLKREGVKKVIALTLYPQYSRATAGSCFSALEKATSGLSWEIETIPHWHTHPSFIETWTHLIEKELPGESRNVHILFSAHGLPMKVVNQGDPYPRQVAEMVEAIMGRLGPVPHSIAYQSKVGPVKWLEPSVEEEMARLAKEGVSSLVLVPISFVSEHFETLYEMDIVFREEAKKIGIENFVRVQAPNLHPGLIETWKRLVLEKVK